jgi:formylmethanofuran dehydrogenase subunit E
MSTNVQFIGTIHSPYGSTAEAPSQGRDEVCEIEIFKEYEDGLTHIDGFSHLHIVYWLHESQGFTLSVKTPWDDTPHGLFATRSPHRVNPIAYAVVELVARNKNVLRVKGLDAVEGTPVLDIKPYLPRIDAKPHARDGWFSERHLFKPRVYEFKVETSWSEGKTGICRSSHKPAIDIGCPPEFGGAVEYWSPEHLFVAAIDICIMTTFLWYIEKNDLYIVSYKSEASGKAHIVEGDFMFVEVDIAPTIEIDSARTKDKIHDLIVEACDTCMVTNSSTCKVVLRPKINVVT